ncbi:MAG: hypothetical protein ACOQNV_02135 [Mycoplasmoidaceae bacterium]
MENTSKKANTFRTKKSKWSVVSIVLSSLMAGGALAGSAVGISNIAKNYTEGAEFTKTVNGRMKINPSALREVEDLEEAQEIANDCAHKLSQWLKDSGQKNYDVSAEAYANTDGIECYLNAQFEVEKVENKNPLSIEEKDKKIDNDPYLSFFSSNAFNSNEKTFVYRWYVKDPGQDPSWNKPQYTVIPFREIFSLPKTTDKQDHKARTLVSEDGENGVVLEVQESTILSDIYADLALAKKDSEDKPDPENEIANEWQKPRLYIVNNLQGLLNEANYHLSYWNGFKNDDEYLSWYSETQYGTFADNYINKDFRGQNEESTTKQDEHFKLNSVEDKDGNEVSGLDLFNYIDQATSGTNEIGFTSKYVDKIVTLSDFDKVMPAKITDSYKNDVDDTENPNIKCFWYPTSSKTTAEKYLNNQIKYGFNQASIQELSFETTKTGKYGSEDVIDQIKNKDIIAQAIPPTFTETIFGGSNLVGALSLGFLIFLIALLVILACLYRTTGVISWICMIFALSMTGLIATIGSTAITMSLLFGLFALSIVGFMASVAICGRLKRRLYSREDTQVMVNKAFKRSLLPVLDISIVTLIFGICFIYIAPISLNALGLVLIAGAFMIFLSVYLLNGLLHGLFFSNSLMINKYQFFGKPSNLANESLAQSNNAIPASLDATKLEIPYYSSMSRRKIDVTNKKALIAICVIAGLLVIGIIVFSVVGFTSPTLFHTTTCISIKFDGDIFAQSWFTGLDYVSYSHTGEWWFFYTNMSNAYSVAQEMATPAGLVFGTDIQCQTIFGTTNQDILNMALISIIIATLVSALYAGLRHNWIAIVPMIAGSFGMPLLILGLSSIFQVKFDQFVVLGFAFVSIVNTIFAMNIVGSTNEAWSRKEPFTNDEFKYIVNVSLTNNWTYIWSNAIAYGLFILIYGLSAPIGPSTASTIGLLIVAFVVTMAVTPFVVSFLLYQFMRVRNLALTRRYQKSKSKVIINYDDVDEQGIEGINKFTKRIPISETKAQGAKND